MVSAIDFCKNFLTQYFNKKDADAANAFLADDVIWITPNEIRHFRSAQSVHDFLVSSIGEDPNAYNVDYAATLSVPNLGTANLAVFEINLIPRHEESSINLRVTLGLQRKSKSYELVYVGMSRKYQRTDVEQIRSFADALPGGVMTLTCVRGEVRLMYANAFFYRRLGYEESTFYEKITENPFFVLPYEDQKRMQTLVAEMGALSRPKPLSMQVGLQGSDGETKVPCQMTIASAYKEGDATILYLLFDEISDVVQEFERAQKRRERLFIEEQEKIAKAPAAETTSAAPEEVLSREDVDELIAEIRRDAEKRIAAVEMAANVHIEEANKLADEEAEAAERLIRGKLEEAAAAQQEAVARAKEEVRSQYTAAWRKEKEKWSARNAALEEELRQTKEEAAKAAEVIAAFQEQQGLQEKAALQQQEESAGRIHALEEELQQAREEAKAQEEQLSDTIAKQREEFEVQAAAGKQREELQENARQASARAFAQKEQELTLVRGQLQKEQEEAKTRESALSGTIAKQQEELKNQQLALRKAQADSAARSKEKDKSIQRMENLLKGQLQSVRSIAGAAGRERKPEELRRQMAKIAGITKELPDYIEDLAAISALNPSERRAYEDRFTISGCLDLARAVIRPQCRQKGIIFSAEQAPGMPDKVIGSKAGLELAFLCLLENAVQYTLNGGQITLSARSENAVRGSVYYCFTVSDTGQGIPEDRLSGLFDNPESELYVARTVMASMGGAIQVRSKEGEGTVFEIRVSLKLQ